VPYAWPQEFDIPQASLNELSELALGNQNHFTEIFNQFIAQYAPEIPRVENAFRLSSKRALIFNYPEFDSVRGNNSEVERLYIGYNFEPDPLPPDWKIRLDNSKNAAPVILITFGTFLSARADVLAKTLASIIKAYPNAVCIVVGGASTQELGRWQSERVFIEEFLPQKALLPYVDLVIHHGGCNSFTESLYFAKPMLIMPFSSDQFAIAHDAQRHQLTACLDPNNFDESELVTKTSELLGNLSYRQALLSWSNHVKKRGPDYAVQHLQSVSKK
jgi:UDP:flavonoid glycosyltransferase YjiC (YdhE family)